jgi:hypothetical protein
LLIFSSCATPAYKEEAFKFDARSSKVFKSLTKYNILYFENERMIRKKIFISTCDSILENYKGGLMSPRPYKIL